MTSFNLLREQWIPVVTKSGDQDLLGIDSVFRRAHELRCVRAEAPVVTAALYRMLLAFAHRIYDGPRSLEEWSRLWESREFAGQALDKYWQDHPDAFELLGGDRPFMQCPGLSTVEPKSANQLLLHRAKGNNTTLFDHTTDGERPDLPADVAARWLVTIQAFDTGGTKTPYEKKKSSKPGLCNQFATVLLEGDSLKETLLLNMVLYAPDLGLPLPTTTAEDRPIWERAQPPGPEPVEEGQIPKGWTDLLTWPSRRILLHGRETDEDGIVVDGAVIAPGTQFGAELQQIEAMAAFQRPNKKGVSYPVRLEILRGVWRHVAELLLPVEEDGIRTRSLTIENVANLVDNSLRADKVITLRMFGQKLMSNPGAIEYWSEEALPVRLAILRPRSLKRSMEEVLESSVGLADDVGAALQQMTTNYSFDLRGGFDRFNHWSYLAERYWPRLYADIVDFFHDVGDVVQALRDDAQEGRPRLAMHLETWRANVDGTTRDALRTWVDKLPRSAPRQLLAMASAEMIFIGTLRGAQLEASVRRWPVNQVTIESENSDSLGSPHERRKRFVMDLYEVGNSLESDNRYQVANARKILARLRRSLTDERYVMHVYELLLPYKVLETQERHCLLVAGLFALNPITARKDEQRWSLCAALADAGSSGAAVARARELIAATEVGGTAYRLRQAVQLIGGAQKRMPLDFESLLTDLIELDTDETTARKVRLRWARDFQHQVHTR